MPFKLGIKKTNKQTLFTYPFEHDLETDSKKFLKVTNN